MTQRSVLVASTVVAEPRSPGQPGGYGHVPRSSPSPLDALFLLGALVPGLLVILVMILGSFKPLSRGMT